MNPSGGDDGNDKKRPGSRDITQVLDLDSMDSQKPSVIDQLVPVEVAEEDSLADVAEVDLAAEQIYNGTIVTVHGVSPSQLARSVDRVQGDAGVPTIPGGRSTRKPPPMREGLEDVGEIARGGMGSIRKVMDTAVRRPVAMKVLDAMAAREGGAAQRFLEEARITGQLEHPNIVPVYELATREDGSPVFFTMKLVQGKTFAALIQARDLAKPSARELERLVQIFLKVCDAVAFAHARGVIHRDLKPVNVMVGTHGQVYVMDWGLGAVLAPSENPAPDAPPRVSLGDDRTHNQDPEGTIAGTFAYMSPEQAWGRTHQIDARTDVFALGAMLYQILTKVPPYRGKDNFQTLTLAQLGNVPDPKTRVDMGVDLPPELCRIAMKALSSEPSRRYPSVELLKAEVERALRGGLWLTTRVFAEGEVVVAEGDKGDEAFIIGKGRCEAYKMENGKKTTLRTMGPGEVFGETAVFTSQPRSASVVALTELTAMVVTRESLEHELTGSPWIAAFVRAVAGRFRDVDSRLTVMREQVRLENRVHDYVHFAGATVAKGVVEARWSEIASVVCEEFALTEPEVLAVVERSRDMTVDSERDTITLVNPLAR